MVEILHNKSNKINIGNHGIADITGVNKSKLMDSYYLMKNLRIALEKSYFTILDQKVIKFPGKDSGITGFFVLSESHAAFHTYPEYEYMGLDIFSCGNSSPMDVIEYFSKLIDAKTCLVESVERGMNIR